MKINDLEILTMYGSGKDTSLSRWIKDDFIKPDDIEMKKLNKGVLTCEEIGNGYLSRNETIPKEASAFVTINAEQFCDENVPNIAYFGGELINLGGSPRYPGFYAHINLEKFYRITQKH